MKKIWSEKVKKEIYWLKKTEIMQDLMIAFLIICITVSWVFKGASCVIKENPQNKIKVEKTGYLESVYEGHRSLTITLVNGEIYRIYNSMYYYGPFDKNEFVKKAKYGDELHYTIWQGDGEKIIYELECNNKVYFTYKQGTATMQSMNIIMFVISIIMFFLSGCFLINIVLKYVKLRRSRGNIEDIQE